MPPVLFYDDLSPAARAVLLTAGALSLDLELRAVQIYGKDHPDPDLLLVNPQHTVPTLVDDENFVIWDSHAISGYLVNKYGANDDLYPKDSRQRALVDQYLHFDTGVLYPRVNTVINSIVVENEKEISTKQISAITESYQFLDKILSNNSKFLSGANLTVADLCCVATVSTATVITPISTEKYPNLSTWYRTCKNLPYYERTNGVGLNKMDALVELKLGRPRTKDFCE